MHSAPTLPPVAGVTHSWVDAGGLRMHMAQFGPADGRPVVLVHGWPQHWYAWRHVLPLLPSDVRVLMPDLRGFGWTAAPRHGYGKEQMALDLLAALEVLRVGPAVLVGHDWGGWLTYLAALRAPDRVHAVLGLAILPPAALSIPVRDLKRFAYQPALAAPFVSSWGLRSPLGLVARALHAGSATDYRHETDALTTYGEVLREPERARASARIYRQFLLRDVIKMQSGRYADRLPMPARLLLGDLDPVIRPRFVPVESSYSVAVLEGVGHSLPEEAPAAVAAEIASLVRHGPPR